MAHKIQKGDVLTVSAPKDVLSGQLFKKGDLAMVAATDAKRGQQLAAYVAGVFELAKGKVAAAEHAVAYFDGKAVTSEAKTGTGENVKQNLKIGFFLSDAEQSDSYVEVLLSQ